VALRNTNMETFPLVSETERWGSPVARPGKIVGIGLNYSDHAEESGMPTPAEPVIFLKAANAVAGTYDHSVALLPLPPTGYDSSEVASEDDWPGPLTLHRQPTSPAILPGAAAPWSNRPCHSTWTAFHLCPMPLLSRSTFAAILEEHRRTRSARSDPTTPALYPRGLPSPERVVSDRKTPGFNMRFDAHRAVKSEAAKRVAA
jgi:hypothetical protein